MSFTPGNIIQYSENYPFLPIAISNLYDLAFRNYDPILGRMNQIDPMATKYASLTPYNFSFNDPVTFTDPSGADPEYGITRYTYDDRVDHYRGQFYSGGSTSALRFHTGGRSGGITNWSYAPSFGQLQHAAAASANPQALMQQYGLQYGKSYSYQKFGSIDAGGFVSDQYDWVMNPPGDPRTQQTQGSGEDWTNAVQSALTTGDFFRNIKSYQFTGTDALTAAKISDNGKFLHNGKAYSNKFYGNQWIGKATIQNSKSAFQQSTRYLKGAGKALGALNIAVTGYQVVGDISNGNYYSGGARVGVAAIAAGAAFIPVVGWGVTIGIGVADAIWGDEFYNYVENKFGN